MPNYSPAHVLLCKMAENHSSCPSASKRYRQGCRKLRKVGGAKLWGALFEKKGHLKIFFWVNSPPPPPPTPPPVAKKISVSVPFRGSKHFSGNTTVFPKNEQIFLKIPKNFPHIWYFSPKLKHFSGNNIDWSFQKCALGKKCNFNEIFSRRKKGTLQPKKGHLPKLGGAWRPWPPGSYAPGYRLCVTSVDYRFTEHGRTEVNCRFVCKCHDDDIIVTIAHKPKCLKNGDICKYTRNGTQVCTAISYTYCSTRLTRRRWWKTQPDCVYN